MPDLAPPLAGETLMAYLLRTRPDYNWTDADGTAEPSAQFDLGYFPYGTYRVRPRLSSWEFGLWVAQIFAPIGALVPPIWPGVDKVTPGTPVDIAPGVTITLPMDGVLVTVTGVDKPGYAFTYDDTKSYRAVGALSFFDDAGHQETYQALGFTSALYTPRSMVRAGGVKVMANNGLTGTLTPYTNNT